MSRDPSVSFARRQEGGLTIIMALVLVGVLGAATFSLSRNVVREMSMGGNVMLGEKAAAAADAALDWVIVWSQGQVNSADYTAANPTTGQTALVTGISNAMNGINTDVPIVISGASDAAMRIDNGGAAGTTQTFDVEVRYLGPEWGHSPVGGSGVSSDNNAASNYRHGGASSISSGAVGWRILATGKATPAVLASGTYQAQREVISTLPK